MDLLQIISWILFLLWYRGLPDITFEIQTTSKLFTLILTCFITVYSRQLFEHGVVCLMKQKKLPLLRHLKFIWIETYQNRPITIIPAQEKARYYIQKCEWSAARSTPISSGGISWPIPLASVELLKALITSSPTVLGMRPQEQDTYPIT